MSTSTMRFEKKASMLYVKSIMGTSSEIKLQKKSNYITIIDNSWLKIAPFWPLKNLVAVNPISGFEDLPFMDALKQAQAYFQQRNMPASMQNVNRESIKWLQAFFDEGQSIISMPMRHRGLLKSILYLLRFDKNIKNNKHWLEKILMQESSLIILECLSNLEIPLHHYEQFLTLMLTTLPGWAAYVKYNMSCADRYMLKQDTDNKIFKDSNRCIFNIKEDYIAFRLILTYLLWPNAKELLLWHNKAVEQSNVQKIYTDIINTENAHRTKLIRKFNKKLPKNTQITSDAQLVFCIDVRSEPFRRAIESQGNYETYGSAGYFGLPIMIENPITEEVYPFCPVLLKPDDKIIERPICSNKIYEISNTIKTLYQSLKYTFIAPFVLAETVGVFCGLWMAIKTLFPKLATIIQKILKKILDYKVDLVYSVLLIKLFRLLT